MGMIKQIAVAMLLFFISFSFGEGFFVTFFEENEETITCTLEEGLVGKEKKIVIKDIKPFEDHEKAYPIAPHKQLISMTVVVENTSDEDDDLQTNYMPFWVRGMNYEQVEVVGALEKPFDTMDIRKQGNRVFLPMGRTREVTYILETDKELTGLIASYTEYEPSWKEYVVEIPF